MATAPAFASTVLVGHATAPATADTGYGATPPTHLATLLTAGTNGTKVEQIDCVGTGVTIAGNLNIWMYDATTYWLVDTFLLTVITPGATTAPLLLSHTYANLVVPSGSTLAISSAVSSQLANVNAFGASF